MKRWRRVSKSTNGPQDVRGGRAFDASAITVAIALRPWRGGLMEFVLLVKFL